MPQVFSVRVTKLTTSVCETCSQFVVKDPTGLVDVLITIQRISTLGPEDFVWTLDTRIRADDRVDHAYVEAIHLKDQCDQGSPMCLSMAYNKALPKLVYDGVKCLPFAASHNSFCEFELTIEVIIKAQRLEVHTDPKQWARNQ